jgi:putative FmdB family regulatory protein
MPLYEYLCGSCGVRFERIRKFSDPPLVECPSCGAGPVEKLISSPAIQFKGSGFYITDYPKDGKDGAKGVPAGKTGADAGGGEKADKSEKTEKSDKSDKPATSSEASTPAPAAPAAKAEPKKA